MLLKVGRIAIQEEYGNWAEKLISQRGFELVVLDIAILTEAYYYPFGDPFDSVITATAKALDLPLITKDQEIIESRMVDIYW